MPRSTNRNRRRVGFTLAEVLTVNAIVGVLLALLVPAVFSAREAARKTQCRNNLRQIGLSLHSFHDAHGAFPPGWTGNTPDAGGYPRPADLGCLWAWGAHLLPQLEQAPLYQRLDVLGAADPPPPGDELDVALDLFLCPSDSAGPESGWGLYRASWDDHGMTTTLIRGYAKSNYVAIRGRAAPFCRDGDCSGLSDGDRGVFSQDSRTRLDDIRDGSTHTLAVGEREMTRPLHGRPPKGAIWVRNVGELIVETKGMYVGGIPEQKALSTDVPESGPRDLGLPTAFFGIHCDANSVSAETGESAPLNQTESGLSSLHPGGALALFADGSVHFLADTLDPAIYGRLGAMADGQDVPGF